MELKEKAEPKAAPSYTVHNSCILVYIAMALFSSSQTTAPSPTTAEGIKKQLKDQITLELAVANATELVNKITQNCFEKCIDVPQDQLTSQQGACTNQCLEKYMRSWNVISKTYVTRIQQEKS